MGFYDAMNTFIGGVKGVGSVPGRIWDWGNSHPKANLPYFEEDRNKLQGLMDQGKGPYMGADPYRGNWDAHLSQLEDRAAGRGPSIAGDAFRGASQNALSQQMAMSQGGRSAGAARQAAMNMGSIGQGLAKGYGDARNQEMIGAQNSLTGALAGADSANFNRDQANQQAWLDLLAKQLGLSAEQLRGVMAGMNAPSNFQTLGGILGAVGIGGAKTGGGK